MYIYLYLSKCYTNSRKPQQRKCSLSVNRHQLSPQQLGLIWVKNPSLQSKLKLKSSKMRTTGIALLLCYVGLALGKQYMPCEMARKLLQPEYSFERSMLSNCKQGFAIPNYPFIYAYAYCILGICLLKHESDFDTNKVTINSNGSRKYGLFQINSRFCQENRRGGECNVKCEGSLCLKYPVTISI